MWCITRAVFRQVRLIDCGVNGRIGLFHPLYHGCSISYTSYANATLLRHVAVSDNRNEIDFRDPITILKEHITHQGLRLVDFFKQLDKDGSGSISRDEFVLGLK
ncbi:hypothetical protein LSAT2_024968, partial [Lamellibrachia satsuma]